jgi:Type II secretion system (T2SS), protein E, N-terminal domain
VRSRLVLQAELLQEDRIFEFEDRVLRPHSDRILEMRRGLFEAPFGLRHLRAEKLLPDLELGRARRGSGRGQKKRESTGSKHSNENNTRKCPLLPLPSLVDLRDNDAVTKVGQALLEVGALTPASLNRALEIQKSSGGRLGTVLLEQGLVSEETLARALAKITGREYAHWDIVRATTKEILDLVPPKIALRSSAVPFSRQGRVLKVAMLDPNDLATEDELAFVTGKKIEPCVMAEVRLVEALERFYGKQRTAQTRLLADKLDRGLLRPAGSAARPAEPPPPPRIFGGPALPSEDVTPQPGRSGSRLSDVWRTAPPGSGGDEIEISTWKPPSKGRPTPLPVPAPASPSLEIEYTPEGREATGAAPAPGTPVSLSETAAKMRGAESRNEIADAALAYLEGRFPLIALFIARKEDAIGWKFRGEGVSRAAFQSLRIPFSEPSLFLNVRISTAFYQGAFPALPSHGPLIEAFGRRIERCALFPVVLKKRVVAFLMVEPSDSVLPPDQVTMLHRLAAAMADGFAALILNERGRKEPA